MTDEYLIERIRLLEEENKELSSGLKKAKRGFFFREGVVLFLILTIIIGYPITVLLTHIITIDKYRTNKCISWCYGKKDTFSTPRDYENCFKQCDAWKCE